jgi:hypothetical protein
MSELRLQSVSLTLEPDNTFALQLPNYWVFESIGLCAPVRKIEGFELIAASTQLLVKLNRVAIRCMCKRGRLFADVTLISSGARGPWTTSVYGNLRASWQMEDDTVPAAAAVIRGFAIKPTDLIR